MEPDVEWLEVQEGVLEKQKQLFIVKFLHSSSKVACCINHNPQMSVAHLCSFWNEFASSSHLNCQSKIVRYISYLYPRKIIIRKIILGIITESKLIDRITNICNQTRENNYRLLNQIMKYFSWCRIPQFVYFPFMEPNDPTTAGRGAGVGPVIHILRKGGGGGAFPGPHSLDPPPMVTGHQVWTAP